MKSLLWLRWTSAAIFTAAIFLGSPHSRGAVFSRDWKTPGDGLLTYDDVNQREWLDLTQSRLSFFPGASFEDRYQAGLAQLDMGGVFAGFVAAASTDLRAFAHSAGIDETRDFAFNAEPTLAMINLVGPSIISTASPPDRRSFGLLGELTSPPRNPPKRLFGEVLRDEPPGFAGSAGLLIQPGSDLATPAITGMWLFRNVPEPTTLALVVLCSSGKRAIR